MTFTTLLFDLDDTVYPHSSGLWPAIGKRIDLYIQDKIRIPEDQIRPFRLGLYKEFGTTMRGLQKKYGINEDEYLDFVHDLPLEDYIEPDLELKQVLLAYPQEKWIFTNADTKHAKRVLDTLEIIDCFSGIIDIKLLSPYCKPDPEAYTVALDIIGIVEPHLCVFIDDREINLEPAKSMGLFTILVGRYDNKNNHHAHIETLKELPSVLCIS